MLPFPFIHSLGVTPALFQYVPGDTDVSKIPAVWELSTKGTDDRQFQSL